MKQLEWLFFDIGSTLVSEKLAQQRRIEKLISEQEGLGRKVSFEEVYHHMENASKTYQPYLFSCAMERLKIQGNYPYLREYEELYPEAKQVLEELSQRYRLGIIANQSLGTLSRLAAHGIAQYFDIIIASAEEGVEKPDLRIYQLALERANCKAERAVMIGDRLDNDIYPAKLLGMKTVWIRQEFGGIQEPISEAYMADEVIYSLNELLEIF